MIHKVFGSSLGKMCLCQVSSLWDMDNSFKLRDFCPHNLRVPKRPILTRVEWISLFFPRFVCVAYIVFFSVFWTIFNCYTTPNDLCSEIFSSRFAISSKRTFLPMNMALDFHSFTYWKPIRISEDLHEKNEL